MKYTFGIVFWALCWTPVLAQSMAFPGDDWELASPHSQLVDSIKLSGAVNYLANSSQHGVSVDGMAIVRNGRLIWEGSSSDRPEHVFSVTKSIMSAVLGTLVDEGRVNLETIAADYMPSLGELYPEVTLRHIATMTSGYQGAGETPPFDLTDTPLTPDTPFFAPGSQFAYSNGSAMDIMASVLTQVANEPIEDFFKRKIADPIGLEGWSWEELESENPPDQIVNKGSVGFHVSARELARFGHLFLNRGTWNGEQILSEAWVEAATSVQVPANTQEHPENDVSNLGGPGVYGFNWWINGTRSDNTQLLPGAPTGTYSAIGFSGNRLFVAPKWNMVIARTSPVDFNAPSTDVFGEFLRQLGDSIVPFSMGDFNEDGMVSITDINLLVREAAAAIPNVEYDLTADHFVDSDDIHFWVEHIADTWIGDSNLDGEFNSGDFVQVFQAGKYESDEFAYWHEGNWNGDSRFDSGDLVLAFQDGGYEKGRRAVAVPEPSSVSLMVIILFLWIRHKPALLQSTKRPVTPEWNRLRTQSFVILMTIYCASPAAFAEYSVERIASLSPYISSFKHTFETVNESLIFTAEGHNGVELFVTDGSDVFEFDINPGLGSSVPALFGADEWPICCEFASINDRVVFSARAPQGQRLFATDGASVDELGDVVPKSLTYEPSNFVALGDELLFRGVSSNGIGLFKTDGSTVEQMFDFNLAGYQPWNFFQHEESLFFTAHTQSGLGLFNTDGTVVNKIVDLANGNSFGPQEFVVRDSDVFFVSRGSDRGKIFRIVEQLPIEVVGAYRDPSQITTLEGEIFFHATPTIDGPTGSALFKVVDDETIRLTEKFQSIEIHHDFTSLTNELYFTGTTRGGRQSTLFKTDGVNVTSFDSYSHGRNPFEFEGQLYFTVTNESGTGRLVKTDGVTITEVGVAAESNVVEFDGGVFYATWITDAFELYRSDGATSEPIFRIDPGERSFVNYSYQPGPVEFSGDLFFFADFIGDDADQVEGLFRLTIVPEPSHLGWSFFAFTLLGIRRFRSDRETS